MQNDFEKKVQQQMEQFEIAPQEAVWLKVEEKIRKDKNKKRAFYYWLSAAILIIIGVGSFVYISNQKQDSQHLVDNKNARKFPNKSSHLATDTISITHKGFLSKSAHNQVVETTKASGSKANIDTKIIIGTHSSATKRENQRAELFKEVYTKTPVKLYTDNLSKSVSSINVNVDSTEREIVASKVIGQKQATDSSSLSELPKKGSTINNTVTDTSSNKTSIKIDALTSTKSSQTRKIRFGVASLAGISNNVTTLVGLPAAAAARDQSFNSPTTTATSNNFVYVPVVNKYNPAFSIGLGVFAQVDLTKRLSVSAGVKYHSYASKLEVGSKVDSSRTFNDNQLKKRASVNSFYKVGNQNSYVNRYDLLSMPINLRWRLNNNEVKPLQLSAGINPGFIASSSSLYYNSLQRVYYKEEQQLQSFQLGLETGLMFTLSNSFTYKFQTGPTLQYNITNLTKSAVGTREHLLFAGIKTAVIF